MQRSIKPHLAVLVVAGGMPFLCICSAGANDPDNAAVKCLSNVLLTASNTVSVKPAKDWPFKIEDFWTIRKGVSYTFRNADGTEQTIGVYLATELKAQHIEGVVFPFGAPAIRDDNGRYGLILRDPYPVEWYPRDKEVFIPPNRTDYVQQRSKEHPLYELWDKLAAQCGIDNQERRGLPIL